MFTYQKIGFKSTPQEIESNLGSVLTLVGRNKHINDAVLYSYDNLLVITGYKWDYTFYKWG